MSSLLEEWYSPVPLHVLFKVHSEVHLVKNFAEEKLAYYKGKDIKLSHFTDSETSSVLA